MTTKIYKTWYGQWRWRIKAANNKIVAASSESFKSKTNCENNLWLTHQALTSYYLDDVLLD